MFPLPKNRYALLVACTAYKDGDLRKLATPGADVQALADVLSDPTVGGFTVKTIVNKSWWAVQQAIARFFANRDPEDFLLVYFSCHGLKSDDGHLYFAMCDTDRNMLRASTVPDDFVQELMRTSRARQQVIILDCCYGGFFTSRMLTKSDSSVDDVDRFQAHGAVIMTASNAIQYAFEGGELKNDSTLSVFTSTVVKGLCTGAADLDGDGLISAVDLIGYTRRQMRSESRTQTPTISTIGQEGEIYIAAVPSSKRKGRRQDSFVLPSPDGWIDLTRFLDRSSSATTKNAVLIAMEMSFAYQGRRISLSDTDLCAKLNKLCKRKADKEGFVMEDMIYVIDHMGVKTDRSKKVYTARSIRLVALDDILGQLRLGRPVVAGMIWRERWFNEPISKTGKLDLCGDDGTTVGGSMITIVGCNEEDKSLRFMWHLDWGDRGLGWMSRETAAACIDKPFSIETAEMIMPYTRQ